jgi:hypothetical protein
MEIAEADSEMSDLTRDEDDDEVPAIVSPSVWDMSSKGPFVQTNADHWSEDDDDDIMWSFQRRKIVFKFIDQHPNGATEKDLWRLLSRDPIFNELTVYGTVMCPASGLFHTFLPHENCGFTEARAGRDADSDASSALARAGKMRDMASNKKMCKVCLRQFNPLENKPGDCRHEKPWHSALSDCSIKCARVGRNVGKQHWGCCFSLDGHKSACSKSKAHVPIDSHVETKIILSASTETSATGD